MLHTAPCVLLAYPGNPLPLMAADGTRGEVFKMFRHRRRSEDSRAAICYRFDQPSPERYYAPSFTLFELFQLSGPVVDIVLKVQLLGQGNELLKLQLCIRHLILLSKE